MYLSLFIKLIKLIMAFTPEESSLITYFENKNDDPYIAVKMKNVTNTAKLCHAQDIYDFFSSDKSLYKFSCICTFDKNIQPIKNHKGIYRCNKFQPIDYSNHKFFNTICRFKSLIEFMNFKNLNKNIRVFKIGSHGPITCPDYDNIFMKYSHYMQVKNKYLQKKVDLLEDTCTSQKEEIDQLSLMLYYAPGSHGAKEAQEDFEKLANKI